jgi:hypothetical protein
MGNRLLRTCDSKLSGSVFTDISVHNQGRGGILASTWVDSKPPPPPPPCTASQVPNSNKAKKGSLTGEFGETVKVECKDGFIGGGETSCMEGRKWSPLKCTKPSKKVAIKWTALGCAKAGKDGSLEKKGCGNGWNGGAISSVGVRGLVAIDFKCDKNQHAMIGFASGNSHNSYQDIDCAAYCDRGTMRIYESGGHKYNGYRYESSDINRIERVGGNVYYYFNEQMVRKCQATLSNTVFVDTSIHNNNAGGFKMSRWLLTSSSQILTPIKWKAVGCAKTNGAGALVKTGCGNGWNGGGISTKSEKGDTKIEFTCTRNQHSMIGFAKGNSHRSYTDIDCALYCDRGTTRIYERGRHKYNGQTYDETTAFSMTRKGTAIKYYQDGKLLRTCGHKLGGAVLVDTSIHNQGRGGINSAVWVPPPPPPSKKCPGDADGNKNVNIEDLLVLLGSYGKTGSGQKADFNGSKKVDIEDLLILLGNYGKKC